MIRSVEGRFDEGVLREAADRFGLDADALEALGSFESILYRGGERVLKLNHDSRRDHDEVLAECEFIVHLAAGGAGVAPLYASRAGRLVESIDDGAGDHFLATLFGEVPGVWPGPEEADDAFFEEFGRLVGRMHALTRGFRPARGRRGHWFDAPHVAGRAALIHDPALADRVEALYARLRDLPRDEASYGLIHGDLHGYNLLYDGSRLTVIDFDDCAYGPFALDLGVLLYYYRHFLAGGRDAPDAVQQEFGQRFYRGVMRGYHAEAALDDASLAAIPAALAWRAADLALYLMQVRETAALDEEEQGILERIERSLLEGRAPFDLDPFDLDAPRP